MRYRYESGSFLRTMRIVLSIGFILFASSAHSASKIILVLGDSLSAEYGLERGTGWVPLLEQRLRKENAGFGIINASVSGETTSGGKERLGALLEKYHPAIVMLELGANDGLRGLSLKSAEANLRAMILSSQEMHAKVLLLGMRIPPNYGSDYTERFSSMYVELAKETKCILIPFLLEKMARNPDLFQADRLHPTAQAQPLILETVWPRLKPVVSKAK